MENEAPDTEDLSSAEGVLPADSEPSDSVALETDPIALLESLSAERDQLAREKVELQNLLLRRTAEFDNFRKRTERERTEFAEFAASDAVKALLPILDDFERALQQECADAEYARGVELIYQRLFDALKKLGLEPLESEGKPFDPNLHHAIEMVETEEHEDHTVVADLMRGYLFKGRLLRPAMVKVAVRR
jgi:molecular chaperone GrpE